MEKESEQGSGLFERKSIEEVVAEAEGSGFKRALNSIDLTAIGVAAIIGAGIFVLLGKTARNDAGPAVVLSIIIAGVAAVLSALTYAELASMIPASGSAYTYVLASLGKFPAFMIGWFILNAYAVGNMTVAIGWSGFFTSGLARMGIDWPDALARAPPVGVFDVPAALIVAAIVGLCLPRIRESTFVNNLLVAFKLAIILFVIVFGLTLVRASNYEPFSPYGDLSSFGGWDGVFRAAAIMFFAYLGFDTVAATAEESKNPRRDLPLGIILSVGVCMILYVAMGAVVTGIVPFSELDADAPVAVAFGDRGHAWAGGLITVGALFALATVLYAFQIALTRILHSMARDGFLPGPCRRLNPRTGTPWTVNLWTGALTVLGAGFVPLDAVIDMTSLASFAIYIVVAVGVIVLRLTRPDAPRRFRAPWVVPFLVVALMVLIAAVGIPPVIHVVFLAWVGIGLVAYGFYAHRRALRGLTPR